MSSPWTSIGFPSVAATNVQPLKGVVAQVRACVSYKRLTPAEIDEVRAEISTLREWLAEHQLVENDFIRQLLIEGADRFAFRLERLQWLGWGYTIDGLKSIVTAYMLLDREDLSAAKDPAASAMLVKVGAAVVRVYEKMGAVKTGTETAAWVLGAFRYGSSFVSGGAIAGLLT